MGRAFPGAGAIVALCAAASWGLTPAWAGKAHEHGVARLDVAIESDRLSLRLSTPLDNLVGFERAPRTAAERDRVDAALARLRQPLELWRADAAAGCSTAQVELHAPVLGLGSPSAAFAEHAELEAEFTLTCRETARAAYLDVGLFAVFPRLARVEVQVASPRGQRKATLRRGQARLALPQ